MLQINAKYKISTNTINFLKKDITIFQKQEQEKFTFLILIKTILAFKRGKKLFSVTQKIQIIDYGWTDNISFILFSYHYRNSSVGSKSYGRLIRIMN